jgi:hypothetical protein
MTVRQTIVDLVKSTVNIYPSIVPQGAEFPAAVYQVISTLATSAKNTKSLVNVYRLQLDIYATTLSSADTLSQSVKGILDNYSDDTYRIHYSDEEDIYEEETKLYRISLEFTIRENAQ